LLKKSCLDFIDELSSKSPVPGGGGSSAFAGALGMALGSMVGNLTLGKKKYIDVESDIKELQEKSQSIIDELEKLVDKDAEVFYPLSQAYGLPHGTDEEKKIKDDMLQKALVDATMVPLEIARCCIKAIDLHEEYARKGSRIAISDVGVGVALCKAGLLGAKLNVMINTKIMKDNELKEKVDGELSELVSSGVAKADRIFKYVESQLI
jgi:Methenyl tetrahydrofolate cyclohydrolase